MIHRSRRPGRITSTHITRAASLITERDRQIAIDCYEHGTLTTDQIAGLHFRRGRTTRFRLNHLYELRVLDRFRPARPPRRGTAPFHWILDELGAHVVAASLHRDRRDLNWRRAAAIALADSATLKHRMATNEFFVRVAVEARAAGGPPHEGHGERTTQQLFGRIVAPDSYGVIRLPDREPLHLLLELDRGTEPLSRIRDKIARYAKATPRSELADTNTRVLFAAPSTRRAAGIAEAIDNRITASAAAWTDSTADTVLPLLTGRPEHS